jgi:DNA-binding transcriptional LysR family regulator
MPWLGFDDDHAYMPGQAWMLDLLGGRKPALRVNNWLVLADAARSGAGLAVLPCYIGDAEPGLRRIGTVLKEVTADQWLLVHRDLRALPRVRAVMTALIQLFHEQRAVLAGQSGDARHASGHVALQ